MSIAICTDASALVPEDSSREALTIVPVPIALDGEPFEGDLETFYAALENGARAATSQPSPGDLHAAYAAAAERGASEILSIHLDARVSGAVAAAELVAREAPVPTIVVDSGTASFGVGVCVRAAAELVAAGASVDEVVRDVRALGGALRNAFVAPAPPAGRIGPTTAWVVLSLANGAVRPLAETESEAAAVATMSAAVAESGGPVRTAVGHAGRSVEEAAGRLADSVGALPHVSAVERYRVGPAVGAHTGPHSFGLFWWPRDAETLASGAVR